MLKIILSLTLIYSFALSFEVKKSTTFTKKIQPTLMSTSFTANMLDKDKNKIQKVFKKAIVITSKENICKNGSYKIQPLYSYLKDKNNNSKRVFNGYSGNINFTCKFKNTDKMDTIISNLDKLGSKKDTLKLTLNPISWILEEDVSKLAFNELELMALNYAKSYQRYLSGVYTKQCNIKKVTLGNISNSHPRPMMLDSRTSKPIKSDYAVKYNSSYLFECE